MKFPAKHLGGALALLSAAGAVQAQPANGEIVSLAELRAVAKQPESKDRPLRLRGTVVCYDAGWHQLYLHDGSETAYFNAQDFNREPEIGQTVEITGRTVRGDALTNMQLTVLGRGPLPRPKPLLLSALANDHGQWIEATGLVLSAEDTRGRLALLIQEGEQNCLVYVLGAPATNEFKHLLGARVRIQGINASKTNSTRLETAMIFAPGFKAITVMEPATSKPAEIPVVSISSLLARELGSWTNQWVRINGLAGAYQPGQSLLVRDPTGVIRARVTQMTEIRGDERVDVWGYLRATPEETVLENSYFEVVRPAAQGRDTVPAEASGKRPARVGEVLTQISDIVKLRREEAAERLPVLLRGVMTYADSDWRNGFIQDQSGAIYVYLDQNQKNIQSGKFVEITGQTSPGGFAPEVLSSGIEILGTTNLPIPIRVDLEDLFDGHLDAHWVEMEGVVRRVDSQAGHVSLSLMTPKGRFKAIVPGFENKALPTQLIDALVSVQGACSSELNIRRQLSGITLHAPSLERVRILQPPPSDSFTIGTTPIAAVATFDPDHLAGRRVKIEGVVTLRLPGQGFIMQDASGGIRVLSRQTNAVEVGEAMEVLGFPAIGDFSPYLEEAAFRSSGRGQLPARKKTTAEQILLHGTNDQQIVELEARLLQSVPRSANPQFVLQEGPIIFTAHLESGSARLELPALASGSRLRLSGVCAIKGGEGHEPEAFRLLLRRPEDIELIESGPSWIARNALRVAAGLLLASAIALAWVVLLRRQVRTQTQLIRQKLEDEAALEQRYRELFENANDMVYTHDLTGRITSINQSGERLLQRAREQILFVNLVDLVVEEQRAAARQWLGNVLKGSAPPTAEWDFATGPEQRTKVEISARLIEEGGRLVEVEGIARDITERKRLEREILEISNREQRRIGHDLHDGVCQQLAGIAFMTSTLAEELTERGEAGAVQAEQISELIKAVMDQTRGVARGLFPVRLEENGLISALEELAANAGELFKVECSFVSREPSATVENGTALHLYYIALEAVANAAKHGKPKKILITLEPNEDRYLLSVRDDGLGFSGPEGAQTGMGIRIMHYRARVIGATLTLQSAIGSGTEVSCLFLPISSQLPLNVDRNGSREKFIPAENQG